MAGKHHHHPRSVNDTSNLTDSMGSSSKPLSPTIALATSSSISSFSTSPLTEFHLFSKLPLELQLRIWRFSAPPARILVERSKHIRLRRKKQKMNYYSRPVPIMLQVCQQSRQEYLHRDGVSKDHPTYKLCSNVLNGNKLWPVYISMEQDIVQVQHVSVLRQPDLTYLQTLLIHNWAAFGQYNHLFYEGYFNFTQFIDLRHVIYEEPRVHNAFPRLLLGARKDRFKKMLLKKLGEVNKSEAFIGILSADSQTFNLIHDHPIEPDCLVTRGLDGQ